ncbi:SH3 domain-containing protein [Leptospira andrefontaineae]|uniref:SH3 domain-containing protein n=1 Tax=Leptospira andrefontaineae TaxID=2484976 RepID=UPI00142D6C66|nr:SH3 domain-containing protein [Leptospira andrefontaineae]
MITPEEAIKEEFQLINTYYSGKDGNGYETPNLQSQIIFKFSKGQKVKILETLSDIRRNLYGWVLVQNEFGAEAWIRQDSISAKLLPNDGIGEIYSASSRLFKGRDDEKPKPGENLRLILNFFLYKGEIISFGPWEKKKYKQYKVSSKEGLKYLSKSKAQVLELGKARRLEEQYDVESGCWFGYNYNSKIGLNESEINSRQDLVFGGDIHPKFPEGEIQYGVKDEKYIQILNRISKDIAKYSDIKEIRNGEVTPLRCEGEHCHTVVWRLPGKSYLFATLETMFTGEVRRHYSLFLIVSIQDGREKLVSFLYDKSSESIGRFFHTITDMDANGKHEIWVEDIDSLGESFETKVFLLDKDSFILLGSKYRTGC